MRRDITGMLDGAHLNSKLCNSLSHSVTDSLSLCTSFFLSLVLIECLIMQIAHHLWIGHDRVDSLFFSPSQKRAARESVRSVSEVFSSRLLHCRWCLVHSVAFPGVFLPVRFAGGHHLPSFLTLASVFTEPLKSLIDFSTVCRVIGF